MDMAETGENPKVLVVMGSDSDYNVMKDCLLLLKRFGIRYDCVICSAHRTPEKAHTLAKNAYQNGYACLIGEQPGKRHICPALLAAYTILPVIGVPIKSDALDGIDALLSIAQMPPGIPVATVAINGAVNAAVLAAEILAVRHTGIADKLFAYKREMAEKVERKDADLQEKIKTL